MYKPDFYLCKHFLSVYLEQRQLLPSQTNMVELGNQIIDERIRREFGISTGPVAKSYFLSLGFKHTSIDINGLDGALPINLGQKIQDPKLLGQFDILTNHGTTEHVESDQYICWQNVHELLKPRGLIISFVPKAKEFFKDHCPWGYKKEFFPFLAEQLKYKTWFAAEIRVPEAWHGVLLAYVFEKEQEVLYNLDKDRFYSFIEHF